MRNGKNLLIKIICIRIDNNGYEGENKVCSELGVWF